MNIVVLLHVFRLPVPITGSETEQPWRRAQTAAGTTGSLVQGLSRSENHRPDVGSPRYSEPRCIVAIYPNGCQGKIGAPTLSRTSGAIMLATVSFRRDRRGAHLTKSPQLTRLSLRHVS